MARGKVFCEECRNDIAFSTEEVNMKSIIKGKAYSYLGKKAYCIDCGAEVYVAEVNDYNLKALYDEYRKEKGIISLEAILAIPQKYAIGKRPLSLLLGWGEQTFSRYYDGDLPTKQYSEILQKIYDDPYYYADILESNKRNLKSTISYEKSKKAVHNILGAAKNGKAKIDLAIEYILSQCEDITPLALQKILYYAQGFYYAFYKTFLFNEDCEAWVHGPVYRDVYNRYRNYCFDPIQAANEVDCSVFSSKEKEILDSVIKNICCYSGKTLEKFTHSEPPWLVAREDVPADAASNRIINKELIGEYFDAVKEKFNMIKPNDIKIYMQSMFDQI